MISDNMVKRYDRTMKTTVVELKLMIYFYDMFCLYSFVRHQKIL